MNPEIEVRINSVINFLEQNLQEEINLDKMAERAHLSKFHFHRTFKLITGETLNQYVNRKRIEQIASLLIHNKGESISDLCYKYGFQTLSSFSRALFEFTDTIGSEVMEISKENFRVKLHRAKQQLYNFMNNKCGLVNKKNPCRCARKTAGFIKLGFVDPQNLHFQKDVIASINKVINKKVEAYSDEVVSQYQKLYQQHPFLQSPNKLESIKALLSSDAVKATFNLG